jgi:hypothetical protein
MSDPYSSQIIIFYHIININCQGSQNAAVMQAEGFQSALTRY